ncbi:hypothetical protein [Streptomyces sp. NBC_00425]|uniref:hypothetical protein n=1 Tax=Streptomyces sp. NBC_00425 TaxID=2975740 RepID=UPI002E1D9A2D
MMLDVLAGLSSPSPIQAVSATDDLSVAQAWYASLQNTGVEGVVAKSLLDQGVEADLRGCVGDLVCLLRAEI